MSIIFAQNFAGIFNLYVKRIYYAGRFRSAVVYNNCYKPQFYREPLCGPPSYDLIEEEGRVYPLTVFINHLHLCSTFSHQKERLYLTTGVCITSES